MQSFVHYFLHFGLPFFVALLFFRKDWKKTYLILLATMLVDADHLLAHPIFKANRCSIGFHYLHSFYVIPFYFILLFFKKPYNIIGLGLVLHMATDLIDCIFTFNKCQVCLIHAPAEGLVKYLANFFNF